MSVPVSSIALLLSGMTAPGAVSWALPGNGAAATGIASGLAAVDGGVPMAATVPVVVQPPEPAVAVPPSLPPAMPTPAPVPVADAPALSAAVPQTTAAGSGASSGTSSGADQGEIVVRARPRDVPGDPLQAVNAKAFSTTQSIDRALVGPVALAYKSKVPGPVRRGLRNFLYNLREPVVFLNFLIQFKPGKAAQTAARFVTNTTVGVAGLFDVARKKPFNLPRRRNGFADSFGFYGIGPGPFLFLPLIGPTSVRDLIGDGLDRLVLPVAIGGPFNKAEYTAPAGVISAVDYRAEFDDQLEELRSAADPYSASRAYYLRRRQAEIDHLRGRDRVPGGSRTGGVPATLPAPVPTRDGTVSSPADAAAPVSGPGPVGPDVLPPAAGNSAAAGTADPLPTAPPPASDGAGPSVEP